MPLRRFIKTQEFQWNTSAMIYSIFDFFNQSFIKIILLIYQLFINFIKFMTLFQDQPDASLIASFFNLSNL